MDDEWGVPAPSLHGDIPFDYQVLILMTATTDKVLWPHLKALECDPTGVSDEILLSFIQSRTIAII